MAALGQITHRVRLGALVTSAFYRSAGMLAKQAANIDVTSGGRLIFALGGGWDEQECDAFGIPFPSPRERVGRFGETLEAILRLWSEPSVDFEGQYVRLKGAICDPKPVSRPPIWTGTHGRRGLQVSARYADVANWNVGLADFKRLSGELRDACQEVGRDPATIETSVFRLADISGSDATVLKLLEKLGAPPEALDILRADHFIGMPEQVIPQVQSFVDAGATHILILCIDAANSTESLQRFMTQVVPHIQAPAAVRHTG